MDKIDKILHKLSIGERARLKTVLIKLATKQLSGLDIKKLKGSNDIFRARTGDWRIIYRTNGDKILLLAIKRRNSNTYNTQ